MSATTSRVVDAPLSLTSGRLPKWASPATLVASILLAGLLLAGASGSVNVAGSVVLGAVLYLIAITLLSQIVEGSRKARDRMMRGFVTGAFLLASIPLVSLLWTVISHGIARMDVEFFTTSMRNVVGEGGGIQHALVGTLFITLLAAIISVPIGLMTAVYLVEYGHGTLGKAITFFVDVMTGIPSIVAGLFIYAVFAVVVAPGARSGLMGALALSVLMIPVVVRGSEEMLRIVPNELREASYALGVPKWLTIVKVVLPTSIAGIMTSVTLAIARVIGETAPLLLTAGFTQSLNTNIASNQMMTLPVYVYTQYTNQGTRPEAALDRAWGAALTLILIVMVLNVIARLIARAFSPKLNRR